MGDNLNMVSIWEAYDNRGLRIAESSKAVETLQSMVAKLETELATVTADRNETCRRLSNTFRLYGEAHAELAAAKRDTEAMGILRSGVIARLAWCLGEWHAIDEHDVVVGVASDPAGAILASGKEAKGANDEKRPPPVVSHCPCCGSDKIKKRSSYSPHRCVTCRTVFVASYMRRLRAAPSRRKGANDADQKTP
jgi:hypothetical protein